MEVEHAEQHAEPAELDDDVLALAEVGDAGLPRREGFLFLVRVRANAQRSADRPLVGFKASLFVFRTRYHLLFFSLARMELKGTATFFFAHAEKSADADDRGRDTAFLVDQIVIDVADFVVRRA